MRKIVLLIFLVVSFSGSFAQKPKELRKQSNRDTTVIKCGIASFYAKKFDGRKTATGEIFSSQKYTAACNQLPLHTWVKVTNLKNQKSVVVKINDRMHPKNKRLIDLSGIAAKDLGFIGRGLTRVEVEVLPRYHPEVVSR